MGMRYVLVIAAVCAVGACKDKAAAPPVNAPVGASGYAPAPVVVTDAARRVACGSLTCDVYCVVTRVSGGADENPPRKEEPTYQCADVAPVSAANLTCSAPADGVVDCVELRKVADAPPAHQEAAAGRVPCGPSSCAANEYCITTVITGGARAVAERGRPPSYRCDATVPVSRGGVECSPVQDRQVDCTINAK